ncbi:MAG: carboxypeptidase-like regulatory domain-containing protein [Bacteroidota bacterium]|nr:carboxypeptidase-like regulatory domain-containing protein [Bacteroidota bacterium]
MTKTAILFSLLFVFSDFILGGTQQTSLLTSRRTSYYTYIFKIDNLQARKIYKKGISGTDESLFVNLCDSFPTDSIYHKKLPVGHYLYANSCENRLDMEFKSSNNCSIYLANNNTDFSVLVYNTAGISISDAKVKLSDKTVLYDPKTASYCLRGSNRQGILEVEIDGHSSFFKIVATNTKSVTLRKLNKVLYRTPVKYVAVPVNFVVSLPFDLFRSIQNHYRYRTIHMLTQPFISAYNSIKNNKPEGWVENLYYHFDHSYCSYYKSAFFFSQPKYRANDTIRFQAFVFDKKNRPVNDSLSVEIYTNNYKKIGTCRPIEPGIYVFSFVPKPEYGLQLDRSYSIILRNKHNKPVSNNNFYYEDYELKSTKFELRSDRSEYNPSQKVTLFCKGTDENDLMVTDGRVQLLLRFQSVDKFEKERDFVPDTLWKHEQTLDPTKETCIVVPDSVFPQVDLKVKAVAQFRTSNNEWQQKQVTFSRTYNPKTLTVELVKDSIVVKYLENGIIQKGKATIDIDDVEKEVMLPFKEKINPTWKEYYVFKDKLCEGIDLKDEQAMVNCLSNRTKDSIFVQIQNPRKLPFVYYVYRKNRCIYRSTNEHSSFSCKAEGKCNYFISLHTLWAGQIKSNEYRLPYRDKELKVKTIEPAVIYPGQTKTISMVITDRNDQPVANASVLAYGYTQKFNQTPFQQMPYLGRTYPNRTFNNSFKAKDEEDDNDLEDNLNGAIRLDRKKWSARMRLDSIELYRFLYPKTGIYHIQVATPDTSTQVAPFLLKEGGLTPLSYLCLDGKLVYSNLTTTKQPYSFITTPGWHNLEFRTNRQSVYYDSLYLVKGFKTIFSLDADAKISNLRQTKQPAYYLPTEQSKLNSSLIKIEDTGYNFYLKQDNHIEMIQGKGTNYFHPVIIAGPLRAGAATIKSQQGFEHTFLVSSEGINAFFPNVQKVNSNFPVLHKKQKIAYSKPEKNFAELAYTSDSIEANWKKTELFMQNNVNYYQNPVVTSPGYGLLRLEYLPASNKINEKEIKNLIVLGCSDTLFTRIYNGNTRIIHNLEPGRYSLIAILQDNRYFREDSITIRPNGTNFVRMHDKQLLPPDAKIAIINAIISKRIKLTNQSSNFVPQKLDQEQRQIASILHQPTEAECKTGIKICGKVLDAQGEAIPGASITIKGTSIGTISNMDGDFCICVPDKNRMLTINFIGYKSVNIGCSDNMRVKLEEDMKRLDEVVVVGYGVVKKENLSGSVASVQAYGVDASLSGRMAGVVSGISIRGVNSAQGNTPLYVIDGVPYEGSDLNLSQDEIGEITLLKDATATALYGSRAANGVVIITRKAGSKQKADHATPTEAFAQESALRNHFSDMAFWKPGLKSDTNGVARFEVTFPDDLTAWNTYYYSYGAGATGQTSGQIKAFKPLVGSLSVPRFLVHGDRTNVIGKTINYGSDTASVTTVFKMDGMTDRTAHHRIGNSAIDTLTVKASAQDTLRITYMVNKADSYNDGEKRKIPVLPIGTKESIGRFWVLNNDTTLNVEPSNDMGTAHLTIDADPFSFVMDELNHIRNYDYYCNEQLASKLKGLLLEEKICRILHKLFPYGKDIPKIIAKLKTSRTNNRLWGWWPDMPYSSWISRQVIEALIMAQKAGYKTGISPKSLVADLNEHLEEKDPRDRIRAICTLMQLDSTASYTALVEKIDNRKFGFTENLELMELRQQCGLAIRPDTLMPLKKESALGNTYWGAPSVSLFDDAIPSTLLVYKIFQKASMQTALLPSMRNYFLERRGNSLHWQNTYESMQVLETILPDMVTTPDALKAPHVRLEGAIQLDSTAYPIRKTFVPTSPLKITKEGKAPVYLSVWQDKWNSAPAKVEKEFTVNTFFDKGDTILKAGKAITLTAEVKVKGSSEYVMIEIPIPAGCSYEEKPNYLLNEVHREYFKEKCVIFCSHLNNGIYRFPIRLMPRYTGRYTLNPARAELMYFPVKFGITTLRQVEIK